MVASAPTRQRAHKELRWFLRQSRAPRLRTLREFAEQEIVIPEGPYRGRRFRCGRQPYCGLWFDAVSSGLWRRFVATGPTQSGKTLSCFIIPVLYHLFEIGETVIVGVPDMDMAGDKWERDLRPVIERSRFRGLIPTSGRGSRGGRVESITFKNGATLKFMSGGGGDKARAGFTSRVVCITETDGLDTVGESSREADKVTQLEARTFAYGDAARIYMECTTSVEQGRTWREYQQGTCSRILMPCAICRDFVSPEREHLEGWQESETAIEARNGSAFVCPSCGSRWTEPSRIDANRRSVLLHKGQTITRGEGGEAVIEGDLPLTDTLGFRWSAVNNLFQSPGSAGAKEWAAKRANDEENAERELCQFIFAIPYQSPAVDLTSLDRDELMKRVPGDVRMVAGSVPDWVTKITAAVDIGKFLIHYVVIGWGEGARGHIITYGAYDVPSQDMGTERALLAVLNGFRDRCEGGWAKIGGEPMAPDQVWIDAGWMGHVVRELCAIDLDESGRSARRARYRPAIGRGAGQQHATRYQQPKSTGARVVHIGQGYHIVKQPGERSLLIEVNSDHWKTFAHERLSTPLDAPGAMTLYRGGVNEHMRLCHHLTAERQVKDFDPKKGEFIRWERLRKSNHFLDCTYNACAAAHLCGIELIEQTKPRPVPPRKPQRPFTTLDGRPYLVTERRR